MLEKSVLEFIEITDSSSPTPGGGSVSSLVGVLGVSLSRMYGHLSVNKKKFLALDESKQKHFIENFEALKEKSEALIQGVYQDIDAYNHVMSAYRLPKNSDEEKAKRLEAIKQATYVAIESPYAIMKAGVEAMRLCVDLIDDGNKNAVSDLACGVILLDSAIESASINVIINLASLDQDEKELWQNKMTSLLEESHLLKENIVSRVKEILQ